MPKPLIVSLDQSPQLKMVGEELTILASGAQTGSYEIFRQAGPEGSGPPPHRHDWDEAFYVIAGEVQFGVDDQQDLVARAGTLVHVPGGSMHWFRFGEGGGEMISMTSREGASAFFTEVDREVSPVDPDLGALVGIAAAHKIEIPVPA
ncbi:MAG TPA: cupin domain-containing protein [Acidimicrobiales bacterium]|nr:cupin domain-containing protein [Acidimicrobiales bacterium]